MKKVIRFTADWCQPCKAYAPIFDEVQNEIEEVEFIVVDINKDTTGAAADYEVRSIPLTVIIDGDKIIKEPGLLSKTQLINLIK